MRGVVFAVAVTAARLTGSARPRAVSAVEPSRGRNLVYVAVGSSDLARADDHRAAEVKPAVIEASRRIALVKEQRSHGNPDPTELGDGEYG